MKLALRLARLGYQNNEVPIGAVVVLNEQIIGEGHNRTITDCDPSAHAEIVALRKAAERIGNHRLPGARMYVTIEPCSMCAGAIIQARLDAVIFGAADLKAGAAGSVLNILKNTELNHQCKLTSGVLERECAEVVQQFFSRRRNQKK